MRKLFFFCSIILAMSILNSCKKDNIATAETPKNLFNTTIKTDPTTDKAVKDKILKFDTKLKNYNPSKDGESYMDIDDVEWYLEASLNFNYAEAGETFADYTIPKFTFLAPAGTEGIEFQDIQDMYLEMVDSIENAYYEITGISKKVIAIDIKIEEAIPAGPMVLVDCYPILGFTPSENTFTSANNDNWYWGWDLGKTNGDFSGQYDAADMLTLKANQALNSNFDLSQYTFTDVNIVTIMPFEVSYNSSFGLSMLFEGNSTNDFLDVNEMNFRLDRVVYISQMSAFKDPLKGIISFNVLDDFSTGTPQYVFHRLKVTYGLPHLF